MLIFSPLLTSSIQNNLISLVLVFSSLTVVKLKLGVIKYTVT